jgi:Ser-tRNA(Ala) deacylase AlaX
VTRWSYQTDAYADRIVSRVRSVAEGCVFLEDTVFHPRGGGQPGDRGTLATDGRRWTVADAEERPDGIAHRLADGEAPPSVGTELTAQLDWERRYRFMRYHSALHLLSGVVYQRFASGITGNQIAEDRVRIDFSLPDFGRPLAEELLAATNAVAARGLSVEVRFISEAERASRPELVRVATDMSSSGGEVRLIDIAGFDVQADGGTHVRTTTEVGVLQLDRIENKGARNKRLYIALDPRPPPPAHAASTGL